MGSRISLLHSTGEMPTRERSTSSQTPRIPTTTSTDWAGYALPFLPLVTRSFQAVLVDKDKVEIENVTRSALFSCQDSVEEAPKVEVVQRWL